MIGWSYEDEPTGLDEQPYETILMVWTVYYMCDKQ